MPFIRGAPECKKIYLPIFLYTIISSVSLCSFSITVFLVVFSPFVFVKLWANAKHDSVFGESVKQYQIQMACTSNIYWTAATNFMPVLGAIIADSYVDRFPMIKFGSVVSLLVIIWYLHLEILLANCVLHISFPFLLV